MCECVFCHKEKFITDFVYEDEVVMAFMDYFVGYGFKKYLINVQQAILSYLLDKK